MSDYYDGARILITGVSGFLGRHLVRRLARERGIASMVGIARSEARVLKLKQMYPDLNVVIADIADTMLMEVLFLEHKFTHVFHTAAMKNPSLCEQNPAACVETNVTASRNLIRLSQCSGVVDFVAVSTDKANSPTCVYGMSKGLMEAMVLDAGYRVFQGVNFMWSDGSVLDVWWRATCANKPISVFRNVTRHFCDVDDVTDRLVTCRDKVFCAERSYVVDMCTLVVAFMLAFPDSTEQLQGKDMRPSYAAEKLVEDVKEALMTSVSSPGARAMSLVLLDTAASNLIWE
jgi:FlaA1/EpsC-like NDP-sugar epimerase